jgi:hypothetical protein
VVTTEFLHEANMQRDALGMPDLVPVVIDHPLSTLSDALIAQRAEQAVVQAVKVWQVNHHIEPVSARSSQIEASTHDLLNIARLGESCAASEHFANACLCNPRARDSECW